MKKLLLFLLTLAPYAFAMEMPAITYEGPQLAYNQQETEINALDKDGFAVGWILYETPPNKTAEIALFQVDEGLQNRRIGQRLFQKCVDDVLAHRCTHLILTVNPIENIDLNTLCIIYKKIVKKLENSKSYLLTQRETQNQGKKTVEMTLRLRPTNITYENQPKTDRIRALDDGQEVAYATFGADDHYNSNHGHIKWLQVEEPYREKGIGYTLFKQAIFALKNKGFKTIVWDAIDLAGTPLQALEAIYVHYIAKLKTELEFDFIMKRELKEETQADLDVTSMRIILK